MTKKSVSLLLLALHLILCHAEPPKWKPDILGQGYEMRTINQGTDYSGKVVSTIIRKLSPRNETAAHPTILYIHGFNDYFFNPEIGNEAVRHGYDFYAIDLRKYGRSIRQGQKPFQCRSLTEYFPDIDSAIIEIGNNTPIVMMGHSTGGLIAAFYMAQTRNARIDALILNSPFLDWNLGWMEQLIPVVAWWGALFPDTRIKQGESTAYAESLLSSDHGEWSYRTDWKMKNSPDVTAGWIHAINSAQQSLRDKPMPIGIPILLMYSSQSVGGAQWTPLHNQADAVLDVADIREYGHRLSSRLLCLKVNGGLHDLLLSHPRLRTALYNRIFTWLESTLPTSNETN